MCCFDCMLFCCKRWLLSFGSINEVNERKGKHFLFSRYQCRGLDQASGQNHVLQVKSQFFNLSCSQQEAGIRKVQNIIIGSLSRPCNFGVSQCIKSHNGTYRHRNMVNYSFTSNNATVCILLTNNTSGISTFSYFIQNKINQLTHCFLFIFKYEQNMNHEICFFLIWYFCIVVNLLLYPYFIFSPQLWRLL